MTWLAWRQFRVQAAVALLARRGGRRDPGLTGSDLRHLYDTSGISDVQGTRRHGCTPSTSRSSFLSHGQLAAQPARPPPARDPGPHRNLLGRAASRPRARERHLPSRLDPGITRTRWLATKIALVGLVSIAVAELFSLLVTWWFSPIDHVNMNRFTPGSVRRARDRRDRLCRLRIRPRGCRRRGDPPHAPGDGDDAPRLRRGPTADHDLLVRPHLISPAHTSTSLEFDPNVGFIAAPPARRSWPATRVSRTLGLSGRLVDEAGRAPTAGSLHNFLQTSCPTIVAPPTNGESPGPSEKPSRTASVSCQPIPPGRDLPAGRAATGRSRDTRWRSSSSSPCSSLAFCFWWVRHRLS